MPINEVKPLEAIDLLDGKLKAFDVKPGHYIFFISAETGLDPQEICAAKNLLPEGSSGGWMFVVNGSVEDAVRIFRMEKLG
jgi:hypothetical protein